MAFNATQYVQKSVLVYGCVWYINMCPVTQSNIRFPKDKALKYAFQLHCHIIEC